jgi:hypothetical protein
MTDDLSRPNLDPGNEHYEAARKMLVTRLHEIGREDHRNGYTTMAKYVAEARAVRVDSWIAMQLIGELLEANRNDR